MRNPLLQRALTLAISMQLEFNKDDFSRMYKEYRGGYWFGVNQNGKGMGELFYTLACGIRNTSAAQSYEAFYGFAPFITKTGYRLHSGLWLRSINRRYRVTGFDFDAKKVHLVSYDISDYSQSGKRRLHSFDNKAWNEVRKNLEKF